MKRLSVPAILKKTKRKAIHQLAPAEVDALLRFADPLEVACHYWEMNAHEHSFPICDLLRETKAGELFELEKPEPLEKLSARATVSRRHERGAP